VKEPLTYDETSGAPGVAPTLVAPAPGQLGLFVDIGTEADFRGLRITTS
jgi:hypothetical protein